MGAYTVDEERLLAGSNDQNENEQWFDSTIPPPHCGKRNKEDYTNTNMNTNTFISGKNPYTIGTYISTSK